MGKNVDAFPRFRVFSLLMQFFFEDTRFYSHMLRFYFNFKLLQVITRMTLKKNL